MDFLVLVGLHRKAMPPQPLIPRAFDQAPAQRRVIDAQRMAIRPANKPDLRTTYPRSPPPRPYPSRESHAGNERFRAPWRKIDNQPLDPAFRDCLEVKTETIDRPILHIVGWINRRPGRFHERA